MQSSNIAYVPALDHIRAYAALLALFYHGLQLFWHQAVYGTVFDASRWLATDNPLLAVVVEGHTAVALFMVLSGFIFTWGAKGRNVDYRRFIRNRLLRTYPLFIALIVLGISAMPERFGWQALLTTVFGFANMPGHLELTPISGMFWAVAVEWHFYLLFPFLLLFLNSRGTWYLLGLVVLVLAWRTIAWLLTGEIRELAYYTIAGRLDQFLLGMLAGAWCARRGTTRISPWAFPFAAALVLAGLWLFHRAGGWPQDNALRIAWGTIEGALWAVFLVAYLGVAPLIPARLSRLIASVGIVSYSIYLLHFVVIYLITVQGWYLDFATGPVVDALLTTLLIATPVTLLLAALSYHAIERPFLALRSAYYR